MQLRLNRAMEYGPMNTLARRAKAAREHAGLTQKQAEAASGLKQSDISKIERGQTLRPAGLLQLARAYQCQPLWLDSGDGPAPWEPDGTLKSPTAALLSPPGGRASLTLPEAIAILADALNELNRDQAAAAAEALQTLARAPDSAKARDAVLSALQAR